MLFVAIGQHSPDQCPGHVKEVFNKVSASMPKWEDVMRKHNVELLGLYIMYGTHKSVTIMDAPSYEAAERVLYEGGAMEFNTFELAQAHTPEEAMKEAAERFGR